jgi:hypothetical protein
MIKKFQQRYKFLGKYKVPIIILAIVPIIAITVFAVMEYGLHRIDMRAGEWASFIGAILGYIGTVLLGILVFWQNEKVGKINNDLLKLQKDQSYSYAIIKNYLKIEKEENTDCTITYSAHHKKDFGALILYEQSDTQEADSFNQYLFELHFEDLSKSLLEKFQIKEATLVQDPNPKGINNTTDSDDPIPCGLLPQILDTCCVNKVDSKNFYIQIKIYARPKGLFDSMMKDTSIKALIFNAELLSKSQVTMNVLYKIWFQTVNVEERLTAGNGYSSICCVTTLVEATD